MVKTKIIATLGPASENYTELRKMVIAGLDVVRLNFSHGTHSDHLRRIQIIRQINKKYRRHIRIMQDLEGWRIRVGSFKGVQEKLLLKRTQVSLGKASDNGSARFIPFDYQGDLRKISSGQLIFIDDGNLVLKVKTSSRDSIKADVLVGGVLKPRKGVNIPGLALKFSAITAKDRLDLEFGIKHQVDYIAQSFVHTPADVLKIKQLVKPRLPDCQIVAKIECKQAIKNIDQIIAVSEGIMVARGDMGVSLPIEQVPIIQKLIIKKCNRKKKFVITATQMLEHMTEHILPTRAEVADVANAILDGTDFVMLSGETASGQYPYECVRMMNQIIKFTEAAQPMLRRIKAVC